MAEQQNTANPILSIGYSLGKLHTGMICYLCDLWNEGKREPLDLLLKRLGVQTKLPAKIYPKKEYEHIDLVILNEGRIPLIAIEMKVDDHEHPVPKRQGVEMQTVAYSKVLDSAVSKLFITLGAGEYYHPPYCDQFEWIGLNKFISAVENIPSYNALIESWKQALRLEKDLQFQAIQNNQKNESKYRKGCWNIYVLGDLKKKILVLADERTHSSIEPTVYMCGQSPDTILNFGWNGYDKDKLYAEICNDGSLRIKICFEPEEKFSTAESKRIISSKLEKLFLDRFESKKYKCKVSKNVYKKTKTLLKIEVGLEKNKHGLCAVNSADDTARRVVSALRIFNEIRSSGKVEKIMSV